MRLTLQIKRLPDADQEKALLETLKECNRAANTISEYASANKVFKQFKIHRETSHPTRGSARLSAQAVVRTISKVADAYKLDRKRLRRFRLLGAITYDARILRYKTEERIASLWSVRGRIEISFLCHNPRLLSYIKGEGDLIYRNGKWFLYQGIEAPEGEIQPVEGFLGLDFEIENIVDDLRWAVLLRKAHRCGERALHKDQGRASTPRYKGGQMSSETHLWARGRIQTAR